MHRNIFFHDSRAKEKGAMIIELRTQSIGHEIIQWNKNKNIKGSCSDRKLITVFFPSLRKRITTLRLLRQLTMLKFIKAFEKWTNELKHAKCSRTKETQIKMFCLKMQKSLYEWNSTALVIIINELKCLSPSFIKWLQTGL